MLCLNVEKCVFFMFYMCCRNLPFGIKLPPLHDSGNQHKVNNVGNEGSTAILSPNSGSCQFSAVGYRHTYMLDKNAVNPKLMPSLKTDVLVNRPSATFRDRKNVRNMRLRPRQVLCSKCKQGVHDNPVEGNSTTAVPVDAKSDHASSNNKHDKITVDDDKYQPNMESKRLTINTRRKESLRTRLRPLKDRCSPSSQEQSVNEEIIPQKRKQVVEPYPLRTSKRVRKPQICDNENRPGPVIKISFATPRGGRADTIVKIPHKNDYSVPISPCSPPASYDSDMSRGRYRKMKKALKKAKLKRKDRITETGTTPKTSRPVHHKRSKRSKHKEKKRHKEKSIPHDTSAPAHVSTPELADESSNQENEILPVNVIPQKEGQGQIESQSADESFEMPNLQKDWSKEIKEKNISEHSGEFDEYSITSMDEFSLKRRLRRNIPQNNDEEEDSNSCASLDSTNSTSTGSDPSCDGRVPGEFMADSNTTDGRPAFQPVCGTITNSPGHILQNGGGDALHNFHPLMMPILTKEVNMCEPEDGRLICRGDIVWGKIHGFPWWPGRVLSITVSQGENGVILTQTAHVAWFGSSTSSHMACSEIFPFLQEYKLRHNKKKKGPYKLAIKQARLAAQTIAGAEYVTDVDLDAVTDVDLEAVTDVDLDVLED